MDLPSQRNIVIVGMSLLVAILVTNRFLFFDCLVSVYIIETDDGNLIPHLKFITYSKPTDVHPCALLIYIMNLLGSLKELHID